MTTSTNYQGPGAYSQKCPPTNPPYYTDTNVTLYKQHPLIVWKKIDVATWPTTSGTLYHVKLHVTLQNGTQYDDITGFYKDNSGANVIRYIPLDGGPLNATAYRTFCT